MCDSSLISQVISPSQADRREGFFHIFFVFERYLRLPYKNKHNTSLFFRRRLFLLDQ